MPDKIYHIAQEVDTVIVLRNPLEEFAVWMNDEDNTTVDPVEDDDDTLGIDVSEGSASRQVKSRLTARNQRFSNTQASSVVSQLSILTR